MTQYETE